MPSLNRLQANTVFNNLKIIPINVGRDNVEKSKNFYKKLKIDNLEIYFDKDVVSFDILLDIFFDIHKIVLYDRVDAGNPHPSKLYFHI